jgi:hypothetical protein
VNLHQAGQVYRNIIDEARSRGVFISEQKRWLPSASISNGETLGELFVVRISRAGYSIMWTPPEIHVGQEPTLVETQDEHDAIDVTDTPPARVVNRMLGIAE